MPSTKITGTCLCRKVSYELTGNLGIFQYCHCSRCRKFTGSAFASNLLISPQHFKWLSGEEHVGRYEPADTKHFATSFCKNCGSSLPWLAKSKKSVVVPAGTLEESPDIKPSQNVFWGSRADWEIAINDLVKHEELPKK